MLFHGTDAWFRYNKAIPRISRDRKAKAEREFREEHWPFRFRILKIPILDF